MSIMTKIEGKRGCGYRKPGGLYLIGPPLGEPCCRLPWPLKCCPTCGVGWKPSRGWTWVDGEKLFAYQGTSIQACVKGTGNIFPKNTCPMADPAIIGRAGLIWVGEAYYRSPEAFLQEAVRMGISRRITTLPKGFEIGKTWVLLAHRKVIMEKEPVSEGLFEGSEVCKIVWIPGIFSVFRPTGIEYVVKGDESPEQIDRLIKRGISPVKVVNRVTQ